MHISIDYPDAVLLDGYPAILGIHRDPSTTTYDLATNSHVIQQGESLIVAVHAVTGGHFGHAHVDGPAIEAVGPHRTISAIRRAIEAHRHADLADLLSRVSLDCTCDRFPHPYQAA